MSINNNINTSIFYINDVHAQDPKYASISTAAMKFDTKYKNNSTVDTFKLSSGDTNIGKDDVKNNLAISFLNMIGITASSVGNHECDRGLPGIKTLFNMAKFNYISTNTKINNLSENEQKHFAHSQIIEKNGHKYGIIGASPVDLLERTGKNVDLSSLQIDDIPHTVLAIQNEVKELQEKGVNKIFMISHLGYDFEKQLAQHVSGIDVILGGHSHDYLPGLKDGVNKFTSPTGETVVVTQTGKNGTNIGLLDLTFNDKGQILKAQNNVQKTDNYSKDIVTEFLINRFFGKPKVIGSLISDAHCENTHLGENKIASFMADAMREKSGAQIALITAGNIRGGLDKGAITDRMIDSLSPFKDPIYKVKLSEKELVEALNYAAKSTLKPSHKPGLLQVSGVKYTVGKDKTIKELLLQNNDGSFSKLNTINPSSNKYFTAVYDDFLLKGSEGFKMLAKDDGKDVIEKLNYDKTVASMELIKNINKPFEIKKQNRIIVE